ncbi:hypothetical protein RXV86_06325 [Alisedimentitalea sp. MJ-SS2]|uniref:hypothetical protein n=1 Tax=Aliisedimentitalea sp. MJ-SS2 TaxID=3049795 RepID=UPI00290CBB1A|nr:hypothetical protein [Alisedimentitalea sp. MJ-SS2]MDU8926994.1 hypothetical protein [Alisedimentitalea sp. MJ-SS2]
MHHESDGQGFGIVAVKGDVPCHLPQENRAPIGRNTHEVAGRRDMRAAAAGNFVDQDCVVLPDVRGGLAPSGVVARVLDRIADGPHRQGQRVAQMTGVTARQTCKMQGEKKGA